MEAFVAAARTQHAPVPWHAEGELLLVFVANAHSVPLAHSSILPQSCLNRSASLSEMSKRSSQTPRNSKGPTLIFLAGAAAVGSQQQSRPEMFKAASCRTLRSLMQNCLLNAFTARTCGRPDAPQHAHSLNSANLQCVFDCFDAQQGDISRMGA